MSRSHLLLLVGLIALVAVGCNQRRGNGRPIVDDDGGRDGGANGGEDFGTSVDAGRTDMGMIVLPDMGRVDLGTADMGRDMSVIVDLGHDTGSGCGVHTFTHYAGSYCSAATLECVSGCTDAECEQACLDADVDPDNCNGCVYANFLSCQAAGGCQSELDEYTCCMDENCPAGSASGCSSTYCASEVAAAQSCFDVVGSGCSGYANDCFGVST